MFDFFQYMFRFKFFFANHHYYIMAGARFASDSGLVHLCGTDIVVYTSSVRQCEWAVKQALPGK